MKWHIKGLLWCPSHALDQLAVSLDWNTLPHMACQAKQSGVGLVAKRSFREVREVRFPKGIPLVLVRWLRFARRFAGGGKLV